MTQITSKENITWEQLEKYNLIGPDVPLKRKKEVSEAYNKYMSLLEENGMSINKYVIGVWFSDPNYEKKFIITKNQFPYNLEDNIIHLLVWINPLDIPSQDEILEYIESKKIPFVIFKNPPIAYRSSITMAIHYHLFIKGPIPIGLITRETF